jgi:hypothetical protein
VLVDAYSCVVVRRRQRLGLFRRIVRPIPPELAVTSHPRSPELPVHGQGGQLSYILYSQAVALDLASSEESLDHNATLQHLLTRTGHTLLAWRRLRLPLLALALVVCVSACPKVRVMCRVMAKRKCPITARSITAMASITLTTNEGTTLVTPTTTTTVGVSAEARENSSLVFPVPSSSAVH